MPFLDWGDIANGYTTSLVLGNGASIALHRGFRYGSLLDYACKAGLLKQDVRAVFDHLRTTDFELVLRMLWHARHVNAALSIEERRTDEVYAAVRDALIQSVHSLHVGRDAVQPYLTSIVKYLEPYDTVLSLNYDLTLYWAIMEANNRSGGAPRFKDCWVNGEFVADWEQMREPRGTNRCTLVFYPHGSLMLATKPFGGEKKLHDKPGPGNFLKSIFADWEFNNWLPLFVSEGDSSQKEAAIARSPYLSTVCNDVMASLGESVATYGWSLRENDDHILRRVCSPSTKKLAISVNPRGRPMDEIETQCKALELRVRQHNPKIEVQTYDATSAGCWLKASDWDEPAQIVNSGAQPNER